MKKLVKLHRQNFHFDISREKKNVKEQRHEISRKKVVNLQSHLFRFHTKKSCQITWTQILDFDISREKNRQITKPHL